MKIATSFTSISRLIRSQISSELAQLPSTHTIWLTWQIHRCRFALTKSSICFVCQAFALLCLSRFDSNGHPVQDLYQVDGIASCNMLVVIISLVIPYHYRSRGFHLVPTFSGGRWWTVQETKKAAMRYNFWIPESVLAPGTSGFVCLDWVMSHYYPLLVHYPLPGKT